MNTAFLLMAEITQSRLQRLFAFDGASGLLIWRERPVSDFKSQRVCNIWNTKYAGKVAGSIFKNGYRMIGIDGKPHYAHRLIWFYTYGAWPGEIDHIDHDKTNNALANLRDVKHAENSKNRSTPSTNTSGSMGVMWIGRRNKWQASIKVGGKGIFLGYFDDEKSAIDARAAAETKYDFHTNHGTKS